LIEILNFDPVNTCKKLSILDDFLEIFDIFKQLKVLFPKIGFARYIKIRQELTPIVAVFSLAFDSVCRGEVTLKKINPLEEIFSFKRD
jgi:hypothetical protein